jgi:hypothetical protein
MCHLKIARKTKRGVRGGVNKHRNQDQLIDNSSTIDPKPPPKPNSQQDQLIDNSSTNDPKPNSQHDQLIDNSSTTDRNPNSKPLRAN